MQVTKSEKTRIYAGYSRFLCSLVMSRSSVRIGSVAPFTKLRQMRCIACLAVLFYF